LPQLFRAAKELFSLLEKKYGFYPIDFVPSFPIELDQTCLTGGCCRQTTTRLQFDQAENERREGMELMKDSTDLFLGPALKGRTYHHHPITGPGKGQGK